MTPTRWIWLVVGTTHRTQGTCLPVSYIMKDIRDTNEQPDRDTLGEVHRVPNTGAFVPMEWGRATLPAWSCVHQPRSSLHPVLLEFLWRLHHVGRIDL